MPPDQDRVKPRYRWAAVLGAAVIGGVLAVALFAAGTRVIGWFSSEPPAPPPSDRVENAPAPDNRITTTPAQPDPG